MAKGKKEKRERSENREKREDERMKGRMGVEKKTHREVNGTKKREAVEVGGAGRG